MDNAITVLGAMMTDPGRVRERNEDSVAFFMPRPEDPRAARGILAMVADGMGGHSAGEVASALTVEAFIRAYYTTAGTVPAALRAGVLAANSAVLACSQLDPARHGMGATCTAIAIQDAQLFLAHVGDSRAYILRDGRLAQLSDDDSLVLTLLRSGLITDADVRQHPDRNVILKAVGAGPDIDPAIWREGLPLRDFDRLVLCSDGLSDMLCDAEIAALAGDGAPVHACEKLLSAALSAGGHDNISVGVFLATSEIRPCRPPRPTRCTEAAPGEEA